MLAKIANLRFNTAVGKKIVMAITGLAMCLFLVGHLAGNLLLIWGKDKFDAYANFLTPFPLVPVMELGLLVILLFHVVDAFVLIRGNYNARPVPYHTKKWGRSKSKKSKKSFASTFMMWSGVIILFFIVFHVWHFKYHHPIASEPIPGGHDSSVVVGVGGAGIGTAGTEGGEASAKEAFSLAKLVLNEFSNPLVSGIYVLVMLILALHLWHAVSSAFTSLGANHPRYQKGLIWVGNIFTIVICGGFGIIPLLVLFKVVK
jgi:succinate dehydrogenase / fumarate reductase cytochrome b subunit